LAGHTYVRLGGNDRATGSAVDRRLTELIETGGPLAVTEPVAREVLAGARPMTVLSAVAVSQVKGVSCASTYERTVDLLA